MWLRCPWKIKCKWTIENLNALRCYNIVIITQYFCVTETKGFNNFIHYNILKIYYFMKIYVWHSITLHLIYYCTVVQICRRNVDKKEKRTLTLLKGLFWVLVNWKKLSCCCCCCYCTSRDFCGGSGSWPCACPREVTAVRSLV